MFCNVTGLEALGIGKVIDNSGSTWTIEYFDSPEDTDRHIELVPKKKVTQRTLGANTRVFYYDKSSSRWLVGRVLDDCEDDVYVRFAKKLDLYLKSSDLYVRWKKPIQDPVAYLSNLITETPQYAEGRSNFLKSYIVQRAASWGLSSLISSVIELEAHQINVIRRVLSDPSQRYLLADEVGLGKTIEAGVIVRQAVIDAPEEHYIVILVPSPLVNQWRWELSDKFCLNDFIDISVFVLPHQVTNELKEHLDRATMVVIDEAHHLTSDSDPRNLKFYDLVKKAAQRVERLILLSATPALRNELGFLKLLHLLDPVVYKLEDKIAFQTKIQNRQALAEVVASLVSENALQLDWIIDELQNKLSDDLHLKKLSTELKAVLDRLPDEDDVELNEAISKLRAHLSETYKLNRRILRNRRKQVNFLTPGRHGCTLWSATHDSQIQRLESALEEWRINAVAALEWGAGSKTQGNLAVFFKELIAALVVNPGHIRQLCKARLLLIQQSKEKDSFDNEKELLDSILFSVDETTWLQARMEHLRRELNDILVGETKVVIFCSETGTADAVFSKLVQNGPFVVVRHDITESNEAKMSWLRFLSDESVKVLVCDSTAEEGINIQGGDKVVVHFDLPLSPNRIEQRMGRLDRYGSGEEIHSYILLDDASEYQRGWHRVLDYGLGVFSRSIASLQYLIEDKIQELDKELLFGGVEYLNDLSNELGSPEGLVQNELKLIDEQDGLDELSPLAEQETESIEEMEGNWKEIRQALNYWIVDTLMFEKILRGPIENIATTDQTFRFQYHKPGKGGPATLIPLSGFLLDFIGVIDYDAPGSNSKQPLSYPYVYRRSSATNRGVRLLRHGDLFVEAVKSFTDLDDRGKSFAMWRHFPRIEDDDFGDVRLYFRFDFLIETDLRPALEVLDSSSLTNAKAAQSTLKRRGDSLFAPSFTRIWIDEDGEEPEGNFVRKYLQGSYVREEEAKNEGYVDKNLNMYRLPKLQDAIPVYFDGWNERCENMSNRAKTFLMGKEELTISQKGALKKAKIENEIRYAQLTTRIKHLFGEESKKESQQLKSERAINEALYKGIKAPSICLDVVGAIFLSRHSFFDVTKT